MCELLAHASTKCSNLPHEQIPSYRALDAQHRHPYTVQIRELSSARLLLSAAVAPSTHASSPAAAKRRLWIYTTAIEAWPADEGWRWLRWPRCSKVHHHEDGAFGDGTGSRQLAHSARLRLAVAASKLRHRPTPLILAREPCSCILQGLE